MDSTDLIYLDYQATTPLDRRALEAMLPYFGERFANAASVQHRAGQEAAAAVELAREQVASSIGADPREIVFCSGATEADSLAIKGMTKRSERDRLIVLATEHPAVLEPARSMRRNGYEVIELEVDAAGQPSLSRLQEIVDERTLLVSVSAANNEIGSLPPSYRRGASGWEGRN
jgi:cysteine desulfurase